jgi:hypothetical protein
MRRHGIPISSIQIEVLLEKHRSASGSNEPIILSDEEIQDLLGRSKKEKPRVTPSEVADLMKGVNLTFPDGLTLGIRQASPEALIRFIISYNAQSESICLP